MKFKVGDKVKSLEIKGLEIISNREGVITGMDEMDFVVSFNGSDGKRNYFNEEELELIEEPKESKYFRDENQPIAIKTNRLEELTTALNILGSLGIELDVKIHAEINGQKVEL